MSQNRKKVLFVTRIGGFLTPGNGGQLRTHHILRILSKQCEVDLFNPGMHAQAPETKAWKELQLRKLITPHWLRTITLLRLRRGWSRAIHTLEKWLLPPSPYVEHVDVATWWINKFVKSDTEYDFVILDTLALPPLISWKSHIGQIWLNAHNVESELDPENESVRNLENVLGSLITGIITCTQDDAQRFLKTDIPPQKVLVWANGTELKSKPRPLPMKPQAVFIGSLNYPPNKAGLDWYFSEIHGLILSAIPDYRLSIVGRAPVASDREHWNAQPNTEVHSDVASISPFLDNAQLSIVPLLHGSGSRLKIADSLMHGRPVVSTPIGAEGYPTTTPGLNIAQDPVEFANQIISTVSNCPTAESTHAWAKEHLSWDACIQPEQILHP